MIQSLGWAGSALIVASLMLRRPVPFRIVNLASAVVLLVFDYAIGLWSMVVLNIAILLVNLWQLRDTVRRAGAPRRARRRTFFQSTTSVRAVRSCIEIAMRGLD